MIKIIMRRFLVSLAFSQLPKDLFSMLNVVLFEPEIAPNTGNIIRLCANSGCNLHLVGKLGFAWDDKKLRRAGLDYAEFTDVKHWEDFEQFNRSRNDANPSAQLFAFTTKAKQHHTGATFTKNDYLLFGPETRGLPDNILHNTTGVKKLRLPMVKDSRSLNLSNSAAIAVYEAWRQLNFEGSV